MSNQHKSFYQENKTYFLIFLCAVILLLLVVSYTGWDRGVVVPTGSTDVQSAEVGLNIADPPRDAIKQTESEPETPTSVYHEQNINKRHDYGLFETELKSVGFYDHNGVTEFRANIWVHNVGDETEQFLWKKANVQKIPNQRYNVTSAVFDGKDIPSDGEREGYILFSAVPEDISEDIIVIIGHSVGFSTLFGFTSQAPHRYEIILD